MSGYSSLAVVLAAILMGPPAAVSGDTPVDLFGDPLPTGALVRMGTVRFRAGWSVRAIAYAPNGSTVAAAGEDGKVRIWDRAGREVWQLTAGRGPLRAIAYSASGEHLASGGKDDNRAISVWNLKTGQRIASLEGHQWDVTCLVFLPDSERLLSADRNGRVRLWSIRDQRKLAEYAQHVGDVEGLALLPDGRRFISAGQNEGLWIRELANPKVVVPLAKALDDIRGLAVSPDGKLLATSTQDPSVRDYVIHLISIPHDQEIGVLRGHTGQINGLAFSPDGTRLASGGADWSARIWNVKSRELIHEVQRKTRVVNAGNQVAVNAVAFAPDGGELAVGSNERTLRLWDVESGAERFPATGHQSIVIGAAWSPDGQRIASASHVDMTVRLWNADDGQQRSVLLGHAGAINAVAYSPDGKRLASAGAYADNSVRIWDVLTGQPVHTWHEPDVHFHQVVFSSDGRWLVAGGGDGMVRIWEVESGRVAHRLDDKASKGFVAISPDRKQLYSASGQDIAVWDLSAVALRRRIPVGKFTTCLALAPDGHALAIGFSDHLAGILNLTSGRVERELRGHDDYVFGIGYAPNGELLATGSRDGTVIVWDARSGKQRQVLRGHEGTVFAVAFSPQSDKLVSASGDNTLLVWKINR